MQLHERTVGKLLRKLSFRRLSVHPSTHRASPRNRRFSAQLRYEAIIEACCDAWNKLMRMPENIASITRRS